MPFALDDAFPEGDEAFVAIPEWRAKAPDEAMLFQVLEHTRTDVLRTRVLLSELGEEL
jgi:hypothetical protein